MRVLQIPRLLVPLLLMGLVAPSAAGAEGRCPAPDDLEARDLMAGIEGALRSGTLITRMQITARREAPLAEGREPLAPKTLWAVVRTDAEETLSVYVFSGPGRLAGTTLLMRDRLAGLEGDAMWLYLRAFDSFQEIESTERRSTVVPGTRLTYEDAKGYIAGDKYAFSFAGERSASSTRVELLACPATPALARDVGYRELRVGVDLEKRGVSEIEYLDLRRRPAKRYRVEAWVRVGERWLPERISLEHFVDQLTTTIEYEHWLPAGPPTGDLYAPSVEGKSFRARLLRYAHAEGHGERIDAELASADATVRRWEEKWGSEVQAP